MVRPVLFRPGPSRVGLRIDRRNQPVGQWTDGGVSRECEYNSAVMSNRVRARNQFGLAVVWLLLGSLGNPLTLAAADPYADLMARQAIHARPDPKGTPTRAEIGIYVLDVMAIDDATQTFEVDVVVTLRWRDPRLAFSAEEMGLEELVLPLDEVWSAELGTLNRREVETLLPDVVHVAPDGRVSYAQRIQATLASKLDLREFPFDSQALPIHIVAYRHGPEEIQFVLNEESTGSRGDFSVTGWEIEEGEPRIEPVELPGVEGQFAGVSFFLEARRQSSYFGLTMMVPLVLIVLMAWTVFWIDPAVVPPQIGVSTAAVFSLIAFRFSMRSALPNVAYMTRADQFLLGTTLLVFAALGEVIVTTRLARQGNEELAHRIDRWGRWIYLASFILLTGLTLRV